MAEASACITSALITTSPFMRLVSATISGYRWVHSAPFPFGDGSCDLFRHVTRRSFGRVEAATISGREY
jgi:hypothetical protein